VAKNILIFSDGTGQSGGVTFDEDRTNVYKLFRATRCGPDSTIDPSDQVAFYDPGLGSPRDNHFKFGWLGRKLYNLISEGTGFGITANIIDCYAALVRLWRPGDRIFLFGFSRGAYTVRCVAAAIAYCGIPTKLPDGSEVKLDNASSKRLATYAIKHVYQFTSSRPRRTATRKQSFLLQTRDLIALRFRKEHQCLADNRTDPNVYPYFIGVFDTVAALLNPKMSILLMAMFLGFDLIAGWILLFAPDLPLIGRYFSVFSSFWSNFLIAVVVTFVLILIGYIYTHFKFDFRVPGYNWRQLLRTMHFTNLYQRFYDYTLNPNVPYAKHAISIDENRRDFKRVGWDPGQTNRPERDENGNVFFEQVWFPGNHADIGGGYEENESRLSDAALRWMLVAATSTPYPIKFDADVLKTYPIPTGRSHNEVKVGVGLITTLTGATWAERHRELPSPSAPMHKSVYERFDSIAALEYDQWIPYRPEILRDHVDFERFYKTGASFPATSLSTATAIADDPKLRLASATV
jgi:uncharacterized protein (DUF2235 family)